MKHLIHVRDYGLTKASIDKIVAEAKKVNGKLDGTTDKGATFEFPTVGAAGLFRDRVNSKFSRAHADHTTEA